MGTTQAGSDLESVRVRSNGVDVHYMGATGRINFRFFREKSHEAWKCMIGVGYLHLVHPKAICEASVRSINFSGHTINTGDSRNMHYVCKKVAVNEKN